MTVVEDVECSDETCHMTIDDLENQIKNTETEIQVAKNRYHEVLVMNLKKDIQIEKLKEKLEHSKYKKFLEVLSESTINSLTKMDDNQKKDRGFISVAVRDLYSSNLSRLKEITYSGRSKNPMSPQKKKILHELFQLRLENASDGSERLRKLGDCIKSAIININHSQK